jgi:hypothetical protein
MNNFFSFFSTLSTKLRQSFQAWRQTSLVLKLGLTTLVLVLLGLTIFSRFYRLGQIPLGTYWDETAMLMDARAVARTGRDIHQHHWLQAMFLSYGDYKLPVYIWLASLSVKLFGVNALALRLPSALIGLATLGLAWWFLKQIPSPLTQTKETASGRPKLIEQWITAAISLIAILLTLGLSPWAINFSRTAFEGHAGQLFLGLAVALALKAYQCQSGQTKTDQSQTSQTQPKKFIFYLSLTQAAAALATYAYFSVRFVWPPVFLIISLLQIGLGGTNQPSTGRKNWFKILASAGLALAFYGLLLVPMFNNQYYQASNQLRYSTTSIFNMEDWAVRSNQLREQSGNTVLSRIFYHRHWLMIRALLENYADNLSPDFLFISGDPNLRHGTGHHGLFLLPMLICLPLGLYYLAKQNWRWLALLVTWWLVALLPASVPDTTPHALRALNALLPLTIILSYGLAQLLWMTVKAVLKTTSACFSSLSFPWQRVVRSFTPALPGLPLLGCLLISAAQFTHHYFYLYPQQSAPAWQAGYKQVAEAICQQRQERDQVWIDINDGRFFLWLLTYCDYPAAAVSDYQFDQYYHLQQMDNVIFKSQDWQTFPDQGNSLMVVNHFSLSREKQQQLKPQASQVFTIPQDEIYFFASQDLAPTSTP